MHGTGWTLPPTIQSDPKLAQGRQLSAQVFNSRQSSCIKGEWKISGSTKHAETEGRTKAWVVVENIRDFCPLSKLLTMRPPETRRWNKGRPISTMKQTMAVPFQLQGNSNEARASNYTEAMRVKETTGEFFGWTCFIDDFLQLVTVIV